MNSRKIQIIVGGLISDREISRFARDDSVIRRAAQKRLSSYVW